MSDEQKIAEDEDTHDSWQSWLHHQHTKKRMLGQRKEVERLTVQMHNIALASSDAQVRDVAVKLQCAAAFLRVLEGKDQ